MSAKKTVFHSAEDAAKYADAKNGEPLPDGKEKRTPFKVYKLWNSYVERYAVAQNPMSALHASHTEFGINVESIGGEKLMPMDEYFSRLTPEQLAEARKYLGNDA